MVKTQKDLNSKTLRQLLKRGMAVSFTMMVGLSVMNANSTVSAQNIQMRSDITASNANTVLGTTGNGSTQVDIANPNQGISFNQYDRFNIGANENVVLNNSKVAGESVIGGVVQANNQLTNEAKVIVNEVNGPITHLDGNLEIFGQKADLVIANENGVNVNGGKFINAANLTLTNGKIDNLGNNLGITTTNNGSSVTIGEKGLTTDSDYLNLIGSKVEINGAINDAEHNKTNINVVAGENHLQYDGSNLVMSKEAPKANSYTALSASAAGAMYGNNIYILTSNNDAVDELGGDVKAQGDLSIQSAGTLKVNNLEGKNVDLAAGKAIVNTGKIKAVDNLELNADKIVNKSAVSGDVVKTVSDKVTEYNTRVRGTWVYNDFVLKAKTNVDLTNNLKLSKATMEAGENININRHKDNGLFLNEGGDLTAGKDINVQGDFVTSNPVKSVRILDVLADIQTDRHWERRSLVDGRWFGNGEDIKQENMVASLVKIANIKDEYTAKGYYEALKLVKDPALTDMLSGLLGADWKTRSTIKPIDQWNMEATINYGTGDAANIQAGNDFKVVGDDVVLGKGNFVPNVVKNTVANNSFDSIVADVDKDIVNSNIQAKNIVVKSNRLNDFDTNLKAEDTLLVNAEKEISVKGGSFEAAKALVNTKGDLQISDRLAFDSNGQEYVASQSGIKTLDGAQVGAENIILYGAELSAKNGALKVEANNIAANSINTLKSYYTYTRKDPHWFGFHDYTNRKELRAEITPEISVLQARNVDVLARHNLDVKGSLVAGEDEQSFVKITAGGDVNITNANTVSYDKYSDDSRGTGNDGNYHLLNLQDQLKNKVAVLPSNLRSGGNISIESRNMHVVGSNLTAGKNLNLRTKQNLDLLAALSKEQDDMYTLNWGNGALHVDKNYNSKDAVYGATIKAGTGLLLEANGNLSTESASLTGDNVDVNVQGDYKNTAKQNKTTNYTSKLDAGFTANGKVAFGGMGVSGSINTMTGEKESVVSGPKGILEDANDFKKAVATGMASAELHFNDHSKTDVTTANTTINAKNGNVNIKAEGSAEVGNSDLTATGDVNVEATRVTTNNLTNSTVERKNELGMGVSVTATVENPTVDKASNILNSVSEVKDKFDKEDYKGSFDKAKAIKDDVVGFVKDLPNAVKKDVTHIEATENAAITYTHVSDKHNATNVNTVAAGGNVNVVAHEGDINLNSSKVNGDNVTLDAKGAVNIGKGTDTTIHTEDTIRAKVNVHENVGVNYVDGAKATIGVAPTVEYKGNASVTSTSTPSDVTGNNVVINADTINKSTKTTTYFNDNRHVGGSGDVTIGLSSNHAAAVSGSFSGDAGYNFEAGHVFVNPANGKDVDVAVHAGVNVNGGINADGTNGKFSVNTDEAALTVNKENIVAVEPKNDITKNLTKENIRENLSNILRDNLLKTLKGNLI